MAPRRDPEAASELRRALVEHAKAVVARDGPAALTMRALSEEAGCAVGLPYKVFADRDELVVEVLRDEFARLAEAGRRLVASAGTGTVAGNLTRFVLLVLAAPAVALAHHVSSSEALVAALEREVRAGDVGPQAWERTIAAYLAAEAAGGRLVADAPTGALGFVLAGTTHNLVLTPEGVYPRPSPQALRRRIAALLGPVTPGPVEGEPTTPS